MNFVSLSILIIVLGTFKATHNMKSWLITGASRGIGRALTEEVLLKGDSVIAFARDVAPLEKLKIEYGKSLDILSVDISDRQRVFKSIEACFAKHKQIDVVVNNAGQLLYGMLEEVTEEQARYHMDVNFFGTLWMSQAIVPYLRKQGFGHILQVSSIGSMGGFASVGMYSASKAALDAVSEALAMEIKDFGIKLTILQPGGYATELFTRGTTYTKEMEEYTNLRTKLAELWAESDDANPSKAANVIVETVELDNPPQRLILGSSAYNQIFEIIDTKIKTYKECEALSRKAE